jgi:hypothetical protein
VLWSINVTGSGSPGGRDVLKVPFETLNVLKGTFETSAMSGPPDPVIRKAGLGAGHDVQEH